PHSYSHISQSLHYSVHHFPTRRSSDLFPNKQARMQMDAVGALPETAPADDSGPDAAPFAETTDATARFDFGLQLFVAGVRQMLRSEEHTSELQSRENLVCRLLLEKKKI